MLYNYYMTIDELLENSFSISDRDDETIKNKCDIKGRKKIKEVNHKKYFLHIKETEQKYLDKLKTIVKQNYSEQLHTDFGLSYDDINILSEVIFKTTCQLYEPFNKLIALNNKEILDKIREIFNEDIDDINSFNIFQIYLRTLALSFNIIEYTKPWQSYVLSDLDKNIFGTLLKKPYYLLSDKVEEKKYNYLKDINETEKYLDNEMRSEVDKFFVNLSAENKADILSEFTQMESALEIMKINHKITNKITSTKIRKLDCFKESSKIYKSFKTKIQKAIDKQYNFTVMGLELPRLLRLSDKMELHKVEKCVKKINNEIRKIARKKRKETIIQKIKV